MEEGKLLTLVDFFICINVDERSRKINIGKKKKYTIIEGIRLYETMNNHKTIVPGLWNKIASSGIFPERTAESLKTFWKKM